MQSAVDKLDDGKVIISRSTETSMFYTWPHGLLCGKLYVMVLAFGMVWWFKLMFFFFLVVSTASFLNVCHGWLYLVIAYILNKHVVILPDIDILAC